MTISCADGKEGLSSNYTGFLGFRHFVDAMEADFELKELVSDRLMQGAQSMAQQEDQGRVSIQGSPLYFDAVVHPNSLVAQVDSPENTAFFDLNFMSWQIQSKKLDEQLQAVRKQRENRNAQQLQEHEQHVSETSHSGSHFVQTQTLANSLNHNSNLDGEMVTVDFVEERPSPQELQLAEHLSYAEYTAGVWKGYSTQCRLAHHLKVNEEHAKAAQALKVYREDTETVAVAKAAKAIVANRRLQAEVDSWRQQESALADEESAAQGALLDEAEQAHREVAKLLQEARDFLLNTRVKSLYLSSGGSAASMTKKKAEALGTAADVVRSVLSRIREHRDPKRREQVDLIPNMGVWFNLLSKFV